MAKTKLTKEQLVAYEKNLKLSPLNQINGYNVSYHERNDLRKTGGLKFIGFEIPGFKTPRTIREYLVLLTMAQFTNNSSITRMINGDIKYSPNNHEHLMMFATKSSNTVSVFQDTNGNIVTKQQCSAGRYRSFDDLFIIIKDRFKTLTVEKLMTIMFETFVIGIGGNSIGLYYLSRSACGGMGRIRCNSYNTKNIEQTRTLPVEFDKSYINKLNNLAVDSSIVEQMKNSCRNLLNNSSNGKYQSILNWSQLYNLSNINSNTIQNINHRIVNGLDIALRHYKK